MRIYTYDTIYSAYLGMVRTRDTMPYVGDCIQGRRQLFHEFSSLVCDKAFWAAHPAHYLLVM